jgi:hypothetical protein
MTFDPGAIAGRPRRPWVVSFLVAPVVSLAGALLVLFQDVNGVSLVEAFAGGLVVSVLSALLAAVRRSLPPRELALWAVLAALATIAWMVPAFVALLVIGCWGKETCIS